MSEGAVSSGEASTTGAESGAGTPAAASVASALGATSAGESPAAAKVEAPAFTAGMNEDELAFVGIKGWKDASGILSSYRNLERLRGVDADKLVKLPDPTNADEVLEFNTKRGVPTSVDGYEELAVELTTGNLDAGLMSKISHALRHTPEQHAIFGEEIRGVLQQAIDYQNESVIISDAAEAKELDTEWGEAKDENMLAATRLMQVMELSTETIEQIQHGGLGYRDTMKLLSQIGRRLGEHKRGANEEPQNMPEGLTPSVAHEELRMKMKSDGYLKSLQSDPAERKRYEELTRVRGSFRPPPS